MKTKTLIQDLLTENRFWTFWTLDWTKKVYIFWGGKTKWKTVVDSAKKHLQVSECGYERQVELKNPDLRFD